MKKGIFICFAVFLILSCTTKGGSSGYVASCTVTNSSAVFKLPMKLLETYRYFRQSTPDNVAEYVCHITLDQYKFGFSLFKLPGYREQSGPIDRVLQNGQSTIWRINGNSFSAVEGHGLSTRYSAPYLLMEITNPLTIDLLFKQHPSRCSFRITGFDAPKYNGEIDIQYKGI